MNYLKINKRLLLITVCVLNTLYSFGQWNQVNNSVNGSSNSNFFGQRTTMNNDGDVFAAVTGSISSTDQLNEVKAFEKIGANWVQLGQTLVEENVTDNFGFNIHLAAQSNRIAIGSFGNEIFGTANDSDANNEGGFGHSVQLDDSGTALIVGNPANNADQGQVTVYRLGTSGNWEQAGQVLQGGAAGDFFGDSVEINGTEGIIAIGSRSTNGMSGISSVSLYKLIDNVWVPMGDKILRGPTEDTDIRIHLNFSGDRIAISTIDSGDFRGRVNVYQFKNNNWTQLGQDIVGETTRGTLGAISLNAFGNILAIGAPRGGINGNDTGIATIYHLLNEIWTPIGSPIVAENTDAGREFNGFTVNLSADGYTVLTSSIAHNIPGTALELEQGQVRVFNFIPDNCDAAFINFEDNVVVSTDAGSCEILSDVCLEQPETNTCIGMIIQNDAPSVLPVGDTVVTWFAFSSTGENETRTQTVTVKELVPPVITVPSDQVVDIIEGETEYSVPDYIELGLVTGTDNCSAISFTQVPEAGTLLLEGVYNVVITAIDESNNETEDDFELTVNQQTLGVDDNLIDNNISIYPNPARESFRIQNESNFELNYISIYDMIGKKIKSIDLKNINENILIDVSNMQKSTYFVIINSDKGRVIKKIIVN